MRIAIEIDEARYKDIQRIAEVELELNHYQTAEQIIAKGAPIEQEPCEDAISRAAAIDAVKKNTFRLTFAEEQNCEGHVAWSANAVYSDVMEGALLELPSAQPERKTGRWIPVDSYTAFGGDEATWLAHGNPIAYHYCSECKNHAYALEDGEDLLSDFCPNCGSPMLKEGESDDS